MNTLQRDEIRRTAERASQWLEVLAENDTPEVKAEFAAWITESPAHVRELLNVAAIDRLLTDVDPQRRMQISSGPGRETLNVLALRDAGVAQPRPAPNPSVMAAPSPAMRWRVAAVVAAVAIGTGALLFRQHSPGWQEYATAVGEQSSLRLPDGSSVHLNTRSQLQVRFTADAREVRLLEGEALFTVEHDAVRPFRVRSRDTTVQALGTQFNVYRRTADTTVSVIEGAVKVSADTRDVPVLSAGEQVSVTTGGEIVKPALMDVGKAVAWRERRLVFHADTIEDIATEFNRYNASPRIRIESPQLRLRRFTGVLDADRPESLMRFLSRERDVWFEKRQDELIVRTR